MGREELGVYSGLLAVWHRYVTKPLWASVYPSIKWGWGHLPPKAMERIHTIVLKTTVKWWTNAKLFIWAFKNQNLPSNKMLNIATSSSGLTDWHLSSYCVRTIVDLFNLILINNLWDNAIIISTLQMINPRHREVR